MMLMLSLLAVLGLELVCCQDAKIAERNLQLSGLIFNENLLFEQKETSHIDCARLCLKTDRCETFTFTQVTSGDDVCRGHSARMDSSMTYEVSVGTGLYVFPEKAHWLEKVCSLDAHCTEPNSRCRLERCTCIHGYYYSVGAKVCQEDCSLQNLQNTYLRFEQCALYHYNEFQWINVTVENCKSRCDDDNQCLHFEYGPDHNHCCTSYSNTRLLTAADGWYDVDNSTGWSHYQRNCA